MRGTSGAHSINGLLNFSFHSDAELVYERSGTEALSARVPSANPTLCSYFIIFRGRSEFSIQL